MREAECKKIVHAYASEKERLPNAGYWSGQKLGEAIKNIRPDIPKSTYELGYYINSHIRRQHQASKIAIFKQVPIPKVAITEYNAANGKAYALREAECKKIVHAYALEKQVLLPPGYWPTQKLGQALKDVRTDLKSTPNTLGNHIVSNIRKQHATNEIALFKDVPIPRVAIAEYTANGKAYALREAECRQIIDAYAREARINDIKSDNGDSSIKEINQAHISREKLKTKSIQPRGIKPGDEGLKKTGRGRGQGET